MSPNWKSSRGQKNSPRNLPARILPSGISALEPWKTVVIATLALLALGTPGCSVMHNGYTALTSNGSWNDTVVVLRNRSFSAKAWHRRKHHFCNEKHSQDFCNGFRAGYEAVCGGSNGCTPAFPPSEYWSWQYQSAEGQAKTAAWFAGYPHGARAAEEEGTANWNQIQMSAGMQQQFQNAGILKHEGTIYPIPAPASAGSQFGAPTAASVPTFPAELPTVGEPLPMRGWMPELP
jgi:hypothetical protein